MTKCKHEYEIIKWMNNNFVYPKLIAVCKFCLDKKELE